MPLSICRDDLLPGRNFIGGWCEAQDGRRFDVTDPGHRRRLRQRARQRRGRCACRAGCRACGIPRWRRVPARQRAQMLKRWNDLVVEHQEDLGRLISREQGKPLAEGRGEVAYAASYVEWFAEEATRANGDVIPAGAGRRMFALKEPVGVVARSRRGTSRPHDRAQDGARAGRGLHDGRQAGRADTADGAGAVRWPTRPACRRGCQPRHRVAQRAAEVVDVWLDDRGCARSASPARRRWARSSRAAAPTAEKVSLELGGHAPFIVFDDADLDAAVEGLLAAKFRKVAGSRASRPNRVFVQEGVHDAFVEKLGRAHRGAEGRPGDDEGSQIGPMINARRSTRSSAMSRRCRRAAHASSSAASGSRHSGRNYFAPTMLDGADATWPAPARRPSARSCR